MMSTEKHIVLELINECLTLIKQSESKSLIQIKILLSKQYDNLIGKVNDFVLDEAIASNDKINIYMEVLHELRNLINFLPLSLEKLNMDFNTLYNFVKMNLASLYYNSEVASSFSKANMLMDILVEPINRLEKLPQLPDLETNFKEYSEMFVSELNLLMTSFGIYNSLITNLKIYDIVDVVNWTNNALWNFMLTVELLIEQFDAEKLLIQLNKKNIPMYFHNLLSYISILKDMTFLLPFLLSVFNNRTEDLNNEILDKNFIDGFDILSYHKLHQKIMNYGDYLMNIVKNGKKKGLINMNDDIEESNFYNDYLIGNAQMEWLDCRYKFYMKNKTNADILESENKALIEPIILAGERVLDLIREQSGDIQGLINSYYLNPYIESFKVLLPFYSLKAIYENDVSIYDNFVLHFDEFLEKAENVDDLEFQIVLAKLFTYSRLNKEIDFITIFSKVYSNLSSLQIQPRNYLASIILLLNIVPLISESIEINTDGLFRLAFEYGMVKEQSKINEELKLYQRYMEEPEMCTEIMDQLIHRTEMIDFDNSTILIPDLTRYYERKGLKPIRYIPFNRLTDTIL